MRINLLAALAVATLSLASVSTAAAQNEALAQMFGRGVHAYYAGKLSEAREYLSMAINSGSNDPRAFYFRGIVAHAQGSTYEAESDWQLGAELEARGTANPYVGKSLTRFQGSARLKLEEIRQKARLQAMANRAARQNQMAPQVGNSSIENRIINPQPTPPPATTVPDAVVPPATADSEDPFAGDMADGQANVIKDDALEGAMDDPFADEGAPAPDLDAPADDSQADPFGAGAGDAPASDDPFGAGAVDDPFGE